MTVAARPRRSAADAVCLAAVEVARAAAVQDAGSAELVGEHLAAHADGERTVSHLFACRDRAYRGWQWSATVTRIPRARTVSVSEVVLVPGGDALFAPEWVPWSERVRPGDLGVGDLMHTPADDPRLLPSYADVDDPDADAVAFELGLGRVRVLGPEGRDDAVQRWYATAGPEATIARSAPAPCLSCGFWVPLTGLLGQLIGACANAYSPEDGRVVSADHGCGAHSEALTDQAAAGVPAAHMDDYRYDVEPAAAAEPMAAPEAVAAEPMAAPEAVAAEPMAAPEAVAAEPMAAPEAVAPEPMAAPEAVAPEPAVTEELVAGGEPKAAEPAGRPRPAGAPDTAPEADPGLEYLGHG